MTERSSCIKFNETRHFVAASAGFEDILLDVSFSTVNDGSDFPESEKKGCVVEHAMEDGGRYGYGFEKARCRQCKLNIICEAGLSEMEG